MNSRTRSFAWRLALLVSSATLQAQRVDGADVAAVPVALAWRNDGRLGVALCDAREVAVVDAEDWSVLGRIPLPFRPTSMVADAGGDAWYLGGMDGEVAAVRPDGTYHLLRASTGRGPTRAVPLSSGKVAVTSRWDEILRLIDGTTGRESLAIPLGFPPGPTVRAPGDRLIVADAFGPRVARVDTINGDVRVGRIDGANIRGLAITPDGDDLLLVHLHQYQELPATAANIDWGLVLSSGLTSIPLAAFERGPSPSALGGVRLTLDGSKHGAADPSAVALGSEGKTIYMAIAGASEVLMSRRETRPGRPADQSPASLGESDTLRGREVGRRPVDILTDLEGRRVITADASSDTLTVLDSRDLSLVASVPIGSPTSRQTPVQRGEALFHDGRRSMDRWMSCASCHAEGHTTGLNFDTLGDGDYGASKNTPSLLGIRGTAPHGWSGRFPTLAEQVRQSLVLSMRGPTSDAQTVTDIVEYLEGLPPPPPRRPSDDPLAIAGASVFRERKCTGCHRPPLYTVAGLREVGLSDDGGDPTAFNPPSLRGVGWSAPYLHDGRAASLDELLDRHHPGQDHPVSGPARDALRAYLETL